MFHTKENPEEWIDPDEKDEEESDEAPHEPDTKRALKVEPVPVMQDSVEVGFLPKK